MSSSNFPYVLNLNDLVIKEKEIVSDWEELICEDEDECFTRDDQYILFEMNGIDVCVNFELTVRGRVYSDPGDYWTPPSCDVDIVDVDIDVIDLYIDDYEVVLDRELSNKLESLIKKYL